MTQFYTYLHCKPNGDPFYVGKGYGKRGYDLRPSSRKNRHHGRIVEKHGISNIGVFIFPCDSEQQAFKDEIQQIAQLRRDGYGLANLTDGGDGVSGHKHSSETRNKIGAALKGKKRPADVCAKISASQKGKIISLECRAKLSAAAKGKEASVETRLKMSLSRKGRKHSAETLKKMSVSQIGNTNMVGKKRSPETLAKMSASAIASFNQRRTA